jgi:hypothetical protein
MEYQLQTKTDVNTKPRKKASAFFLKQTRQLIPNPGAVNELAMECLL